MPNVITMTTKDGIDIFGFVNIATRSSDRNMTKIPIVALTKAIARRGELNKL
jgi:hypothetical protein